MLLVSHKHFVGVDSTKVSECERQNNVSEVFFFLSRVADPHEGEWENGPDRTNEADLGSTRSVTDTPTRRT